MRIFATATVIIPISVEIEVSEEDFENKGTAVAVQDAVADLVNEKLVLCDGPVSDVRIDTWTEI